jgi:uroporphyrinogen-III synthase
MPLVVIRPQPGCDATVTAARARGLDAQGFPLFAVSPCEWDAPAAGAFDALLLGSANALRHAGPALADYAGMPAYAVGAETARAAGDAGLRVFATGRGGLQAVLARVRPEHRRLLRLAGEARIALDPLAGMRIIERIAYASVPVAMPDTLAAILGSGALVLLHSAEAARHLADECTRLGIARERIVLAALGPRIAAAAGAGWRSVSTAVKPSDRALLALAANLCQVVSGLRGMV